MLRKMVQARDNGQNFSARLLDIVNFINLAWQKQRMDLSEIMTFKWVFKKAY